MHINNICEIYILFTKSIYPNFIFKRIKCKNKEYHAYFDNNFLGRYKAYNWKNYIDQNIELYFDFEVIILKTIYNN